MTLETTFKGHMPQNTSLEITRMGHNVLKLDLIKQYLASIKYFAAKFRFDVQVENERDHAKN